MRRKYHFILLLDLFVVIEGFAYNSWSFRTFEDDNITYSIKSNDDKTVEVYRWGASKSSNFASDIVIPNSVIYDNNLFTVVAIGSNAFSSNSKITSVSLPVQIKEIANSAFSGCSGLSHILLSDSLEIIGDNAFQGCSNLVSINIPRNVRLVGKEAFSGCSSLESIIIRSDSIQLQSGVFEDCSNLRNITIPRGVKTIEKEAFKGCSQLSSIILRDGIEKIGDAAFAGCTNLKTIAIPGSVNNLGGSVFYGCNNLSSIILEDGIESIGESTFENLQGLKDISIPSSVKEIGSRAFANCKSLSLVWIPYSVTKIGKNCFDGCISLSEIIIPSSVEYVGNDAFKNTLWYKEKRPGIIYINDIAYAYKTNGSMVSQISIKKGTTSIADALFKDMDYIENVDIPASIKNIGNSAFEGCKKLKAINLPEEIEIIGNGAFQGCRALSAITIPNSIKSIGDNAFAECPNLAEIIFPDGATPYIGKKAFDNTMWMAKQPDGTVYIGKVAYKFKGDAPYGYSLIIRDGTEIIAPGAFNTVEVSTLSLPDGLTKIYDDAFGRYGINMKVIEIPKSVNYIGENAMPFYRLKKMIMHNERPDTIYVAKNAFHISRWDKCKLIVPSGSKDSYQSLEPWKVFRIHTEKRALSIIIDLLIVLIIPVALLWSTSKKRKE